MRPRAARWAAALVGALVLATLVVTAPVEARPGTASLAARVDAPDPEIVHVGDRTLVLSTNATTEAGPRNLPVREWTRGGGWHLVGDALPAVGPWTTPGDIWAPAVARHPDGVWHLWYTSRDTASGRQCIGMATAARPEGPYHDRHPRPVVCDAGQGGSIDPSVHVEGDRAWLLWKTEGNAVGRRSGIRAVRLGADWLPTGPVAELLVSARAWERGVVENPELVRGSGGLVLVYSGGRYDDSTYATGTARCDSPMGPCRRTANGPDLATGDLGLVGPGGASLDVDARGTPQLVVHSWDDAVGYAAGGRRALHTLPVDVHEGPLRIRDERAPVGRADHRPLVTTRPVLAPHGTLDDRQRFGGTGGQHLACDLDGDGIDSVIWFDRGVWHRSDRPVVDPASRTVFGAPGDVPLCADFDGDGDDDRVLRRGSTFLLGPEVDAHRRTIPMGGPSDQPVVGDWDGDGDADPGIRSGTAFVLRADPGVEYRIPFGPAGATAVVGDWNGDGTTDPGLRIGPEFHLWVPGGAAIVVPMGLPSSAPVVGRWSTGAAGDSVGVVDR